MELLCILFLLFYYASASLQHGTKPNPLNPPFVPPKPEKVMVIRKVSPEILTCSLPFARFGRIKIGGRGTIVRMANGHLVVFSPVALTDQVKAQTEGLGTVKYLVAPDIEHHLFLDPWHKQYPDAKLIGSEALKIKREKMGKPLPWTYIWKKDVQPSVDAEFDKEFEYTFVSAHPNKELVFNHKPTKTLIQADLMFNLPATEQYSKSGVSPTSGFLTQAFTLFSSPQGTAIWQKRFTWYVFSAPDRPSFDKSVRIIDGWDFRRMIPCHGDVIERNAKEVFRKVFAWHLTADGKKHVV
ncbi:hypothetical protein ANO11243_034920 [Dothideomycetidae sp. 11243]|nr:hypothetical protein ANO11243_034920 [fungal sp. No.11243]